MNCEFCNLKEEFKELTIKEYKYWIVDLAINQRYLGKCIIRLRRHLEDFFDINEEELKEFFVITKRLRNVIKEIFGADMFNYATLGNVVRHVHLHFIPRYSKSTTFLGVTFEDENWGDNYWPHRDFQIPKKVQLAIRDKIRERL